MSHPYTSLTRAVAALAVLFSLAPPARGDLPADLAREVVEAPIGTRIDRYLSWAEQFGFSGAVLLAMDGKIVLHNAYGLADREKGVPSRIDNLYSFGSITKQFTAAGVMKLEQEGRLNTDDKITKYFDDVPSDKAEITIHQLLTHSSGLDDYHGLHDFQKMDRDTAVKIILNKKLLAAPGKRFAYSNSGYTLAAAIIELVTGRDYVEYMKEEIFAPAGLNETGFMGERITETDRGAHVYRGDRDNGTPAEKVGPYWVLLGNGGVVSTVGQMYLWDRALRGESILSAAAKKKIFTPYINDYGYGWDVLTTNRGTTKHAHDGGSSLGLSAEFQRYIEEDGALILASNASIGDTLAIDYLVAPLERLVFNEGPELPEPPALAPQTLDDAKKYVGEYELSSGGRFVIYDQNGQLFLGTAGQPAVEALDAGTIQRADEFTRLNERAGAITEAVFHGNLSPLEDALSPKNEQPERRAARWADILKSWTNGKGKFQRIEVLGTASVPQEQEPDPVTWIRIHMADDTRLFRFHWKDGKIWGLGGDAWAYPRYQAMRLTDKNRAIAFDFASGLASEIEFGTGADGEIDKLSVKSGQSRVKATKIGTTKRSM